MRHALRLALVLVVLSGLGGSLATAGPDEAAGVYALDHAAYAKGLTAAFKKAFASNENRVPPERREAMRKALPQNARRRAEATHLLLDLREDVTFDLSCHMAVHMNHTMRSRIAGGWTRDGDELVLTVTTQEGIQGLLPLGAKEHRCPWSEDGVVLPATGSTWEAPYPLRQISPTLASLVRASPAERARRVRDDLPRPNAAGAFRFEAEMLVLVTGAAQVIGSFTLEVEADEFEGQPAWKVVHREVPLESEVAKEARTWLAPDLGLLRMETREPTARGVHGKAAPMEQRVVTRTPSGYRVEAKVGNQVDEPFEIEAAEPAMGSLGALLLFLKACPDLPLTYETTTLGHERIQPSKIEVLGQGPVLRKLEERPGEQPEAAPTGWRASVDGLRVELAREDRRPRMLSSGSLYGAILIVEPGLLSLYDLSGITVPAQSPEHAASAFALATLRGDRDVLTKVLDVEALRAQAASLGHDANEDTFLGDLLHKLERRRTWLLPRERAWLSKGLTRTRSVEPEGEGQRVKLEPPCEDFEVVVAPSPDGWRVRALLPSVYEEKLCCDDTWTDPDRPEPRYGGCRLWLYRRVLKGRFMEDVHEAADALSQMGEDGIGHLMKELLRPPADGDDAGRAHTVPRVLGRLGIAVLPTLLDAWAEADPQQRRRLDAVAEALQYEPRTPEGDAEPERRVPLLLRALEAGWPGVQRFVVQQLKAIGPSAAAAIPAIEAMREKADKRERRELDRTLSELRKREVRIPLASTPEEQKPDAEDSRGFGSPGWKVELHTSGAKRPNRLLVRDASLHQLRAVGEFEPGTYTLVVRRFPWATVIVRDVELKEAVTRLEGIHVTAGTTLTLRLAPREGVDLGRVWVKATREGWPVFRRRASTERDAPGRFVFRGLGAGTWHVQVLAPRAREPLMDRKIEVDGRTDISIDV